MADKDPWKVVSHEPISEWEVKKVEPIAEFAKGMAERRPAYLEKSTELLPVAGMTVGGLAGGVPGAALGGAAGEAARQLVSRPLGLPDIPKTSFQATKDIAGQAALGAATEYGGKLVGKGLGRMAQKLAPLRLSSGEMVRVTPGIKAGTPGALESISQQMISGGALRTARASEQRQLQSVLQNIAQRATERAGARTTGITAEETWKAFENSGVSLREMADPMYESIKQTMRSPEAATPVMDELVKFSRDQYLNNIILSIKSADPTTDIAPAALKSDITKLASLEPLVKMGVKPEEILRKFLDTFAEGNVSVFDVFRRMRSNLLELTRGGRISPSDARIASGLAKRLTKSVEEAYKKSAPSEAANLLSEADTLWSQGRSLEELSRGLRRATEGIPPSAQVQGAKAIPQTFAPGRLQSELKKATAAYYPGGPTLLGRAVTDPIDNRTYSEAVNLLVRSLKAGHGSFAARWHALGLLAMVGGGLTGHLAAGTSFAAAPELGAYVVSKALTSKNGARLLEAYMRHPQGTQQAMAAGARLVGWALSVPKAPEAPTGTPKVGEP